MTPKGLNVHHRVIEAKSTKSGCSVHLVRSGVDEGPIIGQMSTNIETNEYPGFPTDLQAQWMMLMCLADGTSTIKENIYYDRFTHIMELNRLGCNIKLEDSVAIIEGGRRLIGADVMSTDIRASAALIIAALCASGTSKISRVYHIDRGYDKIEEKLTNVGAEIFRKK